jgi:DUF971 family protein
MTTGLGVDKVELDENGISIQWSDGHASVYDAMYLRINCGCAECVEEWSKRKLLDPASVPADIRAEDYLMVGRYAVQFLWSDVHFTGIYPFEMLRALCRCDQCKASREQG